MNICHLKPLSALFAAASMLAPVAGICAEPVAQIRIAYSDVNLANPRGVAILYRRLQRAAADVCGDEPQSREFGRYAAWSKCVGTALNEAVAQVPSTDLAALHAKHVGSPSLLLASKSAPEGR
jgi:UrcA family protein